MAIPIILRYPPWSHINTVAITFNSDSYRNIYLILRIKKLSLWSKAIEDERKYVFDINLYKVSEQYEVNSIIII